MTTIILVKGRVGGGKLPVLLETWFDSKEHLYVLLLFSFPDTNRISHISLTEYTKILIFTTTVLLLSPCCLFTAVVVIPHPSSPVFHLVMQTNRAKVTIRGQCVLLLNSFRIKVFFLFCFINSYNYNYGMNHIFQTYF